MIPDIMRSRIRRVLEVAAAERVDNLVLGAWGCGIFANHPLAVARAFAREIESLPSVFQTICFAIYSRIPNGYSFTVFQDTLASAKKSVPA